MSKRGRLARERLEIYLVHLILAYRRLILIVGMLLLIYAGASLFVNQLAGYSALLPAIFLIVLGNSFNVVLYTARLGAWLATLWREDD
jgi:hypothetical protein